MRRVLATFEEAIGFGKGAADVLPISGLAALSDLRSTAYLNIRVYLTVKV